MLKNLWMNKKSNKMKERKKERGTRDSCPFHSGRKYHKYYITISIINALYELWFLLTNIQKLNLK